MARVPAGHVRGRGRGGAPAADRGRRARPGSRRPGRRRRTTSSPTCRTTSRARSCTACSAAPPRAERLVLMLQREVAERVAAAPGEMSYLSVFVQYHAKARVAFRVPREAFEPAPKVESAVLVLEPYPADDRLDAATRRTHLWRVVQAGFRERRKMLHNVLTRQLPFAPDQRRRRARTPSASRATGARRPSRWGSGSRSPRRSARSRRPVTRRRRRAGDRARRRRRPPPRAGDPARPGEGQPHARGPWHAARRLPRPPQRDGPARTSRTGSSLSVLPPGTARQPPRRRLRPRARRATTSSCARSPSPVGTPPRPWDRRGRCRRWRRASTSGSRSPRASPADRPTPPPPPTRRSRPGGSTLDADDAPPDRRRARFRRPVLPRRRPGARRGSRGARDAARLAARRWPTMRPVGSPGPADRDAGRRDLDARRRSRPSTPARARRRRRPPRVGRTSPTSFARGCVSSTCWRAPASSPPPTTSRPRPSSSSPASCRSSGRCCGSSRGPSGLSGSGPTHWALYPSVDEAAEAADAPARGVR